MERKGSIANSKINLAELSDVNESSNVLVLALTDEFIDLASQTLQSALNQLKYFPLVRVFHCVMEIG